MAGTLMDAPADLAEEAGDGNAFTTYYDSVEDKVAAFHEELSRKVDSLDSDEEWRAYLDTASRFHHYSFFNQLLILMQNPEATRVAPAGVWRTLGRYPMKGSRALQIFRPKYLNLPVTDEAGNPVLDDAGNPVRERQVRGFTTASVFDVSQTEGEPLPEARRNMVGNAVPGLRADLEAIIASYGYTVGYWPLERGVNGKTDPETATVTIGAHLSDAQQVGTLAHELGHIAAGHLDNLSEYHTGHGGERGRMEVEAESIGYVLLRFAGMNPPAMASGAYVKGWAGVQHDPDTIRESGTVVSRTVRDLINDHEWLSILR